MKPQDSYAILGLRPGAGRAEVDQAYRRLIKRYHPDQAGGDVGRAAELNQAYSDLRARTRPAQPISAPPPRGAPRQLPPQRRSSGRRGSAGMVIAFMALGGIIGAAAFMDGERRVTKLAPRGAALAQPAPTPARDAELAGMGMNSPLATGMVDLAVADAVRLHAEEDPQSVADFSRKCMARLSANPSVQMFDSCAAFDEAIAVLGVDDKAYETGPFNPSTVTARQVGAARLLSADYLYAESRLQQVRSRVHLQLLPRLAEERSGDDDLIGRRGR